uniref:LAGLIDADG homing endonuclease n=1 Tax=Marophrys sp. SRT127 TaxID=2488311 RepID=A0A455RHW8_9EUKA|nr:LAGLIDADG homing endonuclease [Marophrys sp. SRT127]
MTKTIHTANVPTTNIPSSKNWTNLKAYKDSISLTQEQFEIIIGSVLGDLTIRKTGKYSRLVFEQKNKEYLYYLYDKFKEFTRTPPKERKQKRLATSELKSTWYFSTISHPEFEALWKLFYKTGDHITQKNGIKIVPETLFSHLTTRSLAFWHMDDGHYAEQGPRVMNATCSFTIPEHEFLIKGLKTHFNLTYTITSRDKYPKLVLASKSVDAWKRLVEPYIEQIPSMHYKIGRHSTLHTPKGMGNTE